MTTRKVDAAAVTKTLGLLIDHLRTGNQPDRMEMYWQILADQLGEYPWGDIIDAGHDGATTGHLRELAAEMMRRPEGESMADTAERLAGWYRVLSQRLESQGDVGGVPDCYVTMKQMAAMVSRERRTIRRLLDNGTLPPPAVKGGKGKPHEWRWRDVRPILADEYSRPNLPETFPADRFVRS